MVNLVNIMNWEKITLLKFGKDFYVELMLNKNKRPSLGPSLNWVGQLSLHFIMLGKYQYMIKEPQSE